MCPLYYIPLHLRFQLHKYWTFYYYPINYQDCFSSPQHSSLFSWVLSFCWSIFKFSDFPIMMSSPFSPFLLLNFSVLKYSFSSYLYLWLLYWEVLFFCWFQQLSQLLTQHGLSLCYICIISALASFFFLMWI